MRNVIFMQIVDCWIGIYIYTWYSFLVSKFITFFLDLIRYKDFNIATMKVNTI